MKIQDKYIIPFAGQKEGVHDFEFELRKEFFDEFPIIEAEGGLLIAKVLLTKRSSFLSIDITIAGAIKMHCDRCLDLYDQKIDFKGKFFIKFSENQEDEEEIDDVIFLHPEEHEINLKQYFYESICLSIPYRRIHPEMNGVSGCNEELLKYIKDEFNTEKNTGSSPVWDKLKDLQ